MWLWQIAGMQFWPIADSKLARVYNNGNRSNKTEISDPLEIVS